MEDFRPVIPHSLHERCIAEAVPSSLYLCRDCDLSEPVPFILPEAPTCDFRARLLP